MASRPPLVSLRRARITFGGAPLFDDVSIAVASGERACLVGRNGCGKSTLLRLLAGDVELDGGERFVDPGVRIAYLPQDPLLPADLSVGDYVAAGLAPETPEASRRHLVDAALHRLDLAGDAVLGTLSGGEGRRAALARALVTPSDVLLLDEPTNHLDLPTIEWLETELEQFKGGVLLVSHDRALLTRLTRRTLWLDRGRLRRLDQGFAAFADWSAEVIEHEEVEAAKLGKRISVELKWLREGLSARRRRNQGRLRRIEGMRRERAARIAVAGRAKLAARASMQTARLVIDADNVSKSFPGAARPVVDGFTSRILRGDRVGIIGPNGAGKTTLLRILCGDLAADSGDMRLGAGVKAVYFDQRRAALDPEATLWEVLCGGGGDQVMVRGRPRHVVGYLRDFLFDERQAKSPVKSLSGGERSRLLLAKLLARESNLLVLDEPTNDLDLETLDLLQEVLGDYDGSLLVVSHDRDFLDRVVTSIVAYEGRGRWQEYAGGYSDYLTQCRAAREDGATAKRSAPPAPAGKRRQRPPPARLGYKQQRELQGLPELIDTLGAEVAALERALADPTLYARDRDAFETTAARLEERRAALARAEESWLELETLREAREGGAEP